MNYPSQVRVIEKPPSSTWFQDGGVEPSADNPLTGIEEKDAEDKIFYRQKWYDPNLARFEDPPTLPAGIEARRKSELGFCEGCYRTAIEDNRFDPVPGTPVVVVASSAAGGVGEVVEDTDVDRLVEYESIDFNKETYAPGDCVYVLPTVYDYVIPAKKPDVRKWAKNAKEKDPAKYPEYYRKSEFSSAYRKGANDTCPPPYRVARILKIFRKKSGGGDDGGGSGRKRLVDDNPIYEVSVRKFYRPEDTHVDAAEALRFDLNCLFWSDEETTIEVGDLEGKCFVRYFDPWTSKAARDDYFLSAPDRFYFQKTYDSLARRFCGAPMAFLAPKSAIPKCEPAADGEKKLMVVVEKLDRGEVEDVVLSPVPTPPKTQERLRCGYLGGKARLKKKKRSLDFALLVNFLFLSAT